MTADSSNNITLFGRTFAPSAKVMLPLVLILTFICLFPTLSNDWVNWDDDAYVLGNPMVQDLSWANVSSMFTTAQQVGLYHPLTMLSLAIDHHFWGTNASGFHATNLLLHLLSTALVFYLLLKISKLHIVAFVGALLFGMHPMHVESVAWISGRKDVLYTLFFLLSLLFYLRYAATQSKRKAIYYAAALLGFTCSLLSKSLAFTLPAVLILLDYVQQRKLSKSAVLDKLPFFALSGVALAVTKYGQQASESMASLTDLPLYKTMFFGSYNALGYIGKAIVPVHLSPFHPFTFLNGIELKPIHFLSMLPLLVGIYFLYVACRKKKRFLVFGILFYLVTIGPVLQMIPFGKAVSSERYTYIAYIGLFYLLGLFVHRLLQPQTGKWAKLQRPLSAALLVWLGFLGVQTAVQAHVWTNGETLWTQAIERYPGNYWSYLCRGTNRIDNNELDAALDDLNTCINLNPAVAQAHYERGRLQEKTGAKEAAFNDYCTAIDLDPMYAKSYVNRGAMHMQQEQLDAALQDFNQAIAVDSTYALAHLNAGLVYKIEGNSEAAITYFDVAIALEPWNAYFYRHRGILHNSLGDSHAAANDFTASISLEPTSGESFFFRSKARAGLHDFSGALQDAHDALNLGFDVPKDYLKRLTEEREQN
jgi:tetratricopeptide (TPR) repeat protein